MANSNPVSEPANATEHGLGTLLRIAYQVMMADGVEPALATAGYGDIRSAHLPVIQALATNLAGLRATELATRARITKQSMGYLVDHLNAGGYVERLPDPSDQRAKVVSLTPRGLELSRTIRTAVRDVETAWAERVGDTQMQQLRAALQGLVASFQL
jgi:DNA-binding MarR family transcriptional regulator